MQLEVVIYISISYLQRTCEFSRHNAQAKISLKKAQAKAQATRGEKLLTRGERRDFFRNNFL